jgi:poly(A) polymerase
MRLESLEQIDLAHPYMKGVDKNVHCSTDDSLQRAREGVFDGLELVASAGEDANGKVESSVSGADDGDLDAGGRSPREDDCPIMKEKTENGNSTTGATAPSVAADGKTTSSGEAEKDNEQGEPEKLPGGDLFTTTFYIGFSINPNVIMRPLPISDFQKMCKNWDKFSEQSMSICIKYVKG